MIPRRAGSPAAALALALALAMAALAAGPAATTWPHPPRANEGQSRAGVVVRFPDGRVEQACVDLPGTEVHGTDLLALAGFDVAAETSALGTKVCAIGGAGCSYPAEACWCQCTGLGADCAYWAYYTWRDGTWAYSTIGAGSRVVAPGDLDGWAWGAGGPGFGVRPPDVSFEAVCAAASGAMPSPTSAAPPPATTTAEAPPPTPTTPAASPAVPAPPEATRRPEPQEPRAPTPTPPPLPATAAPAAPQSGGPGPEATVATRGATPAVPAMGMTPAGSATSAVETVGLPPTTPGATPTPRSRIAVDTGDPGAGAAADGAGAAAATSGPAPGRGRGTGRRVPGSAADYALLALVFVAVSAAVARRRSP